jgi:hypothetical protein
VSWVPGFAFLAMGFEGEVESFSATMSKSVAMA